MMTKTILVTGSRGVIGTQLCQKLREQGHEVIGTRRPDQATSAEKEITISPWENLSAKNLKLDLIIHLAGVYLTKYELDSIRTSFETNVGLAASVASLQLVSKVPVVALGSFFERAPEELQPWTYYASSKKASFELLKEATQISKSKLIYLYIYDTYGSQISRGKFIDLLVDGINQRKELDASEGQQKQDLTHIDDVATAIIQASNLFEFIDHGTHEYQVRSRETLTLRELAELANSEANEPIAVNWGKYPYRGKEVFEIWDSANDLPNWKADRSLKGYFKSAFTENNLGEKFEN
jgi:nucleoside-diphosphate-sugar epimerase